MSQQTINRASRQEINAPFRAKSAGVSLVSVLIIGLYYVANLFTLLPSEEAVPDGALSLAISVIVLIVVVESVLQIVLFIGAGRIEDRSEHDVTITSQSSRNAYIVLTLGAFVSFASMFAGFKPFEMGSVLLLAFLLGEFVKFGSQLLYYRRSV